VSVLNKTRFGSSIPCLRRYRVSLLWRVSVASFVPGHFVASSPVFTETYVSSAVDGLGLPVDYVELSTVSHGLLKVRSTRRVPDYVSIFFAVTYVSE